MARNKIEAILKSPDRDVSKTAGGNGVLSRLWRQILWDLNIDSSQFGRLLQRYVTDPTNGVPNNRKDQISIRGNLTKEFARPHMTWKVFCKALRFINIKKIEIVLYAHHMNDKVTTHTTMVNFGSQSMGDFNSSLEQSEEN